MSQPIQPDPIQPPRPNELNDLFDTLLDENIHIDNYVRNSHTSAWNQRDILNKIITVNDSALRLKEIADWENNEAQTQYQQYGTKILEFHSKVWDTRQNLKDEFLRVLDYAEYLKRN
ncbi:14555_t:CDS:2 [Entrophospora sp. SA101]|nr:14555_t:CDS:2 [Entrophospora sp. SA101]CAJ0826608.1 16292_t:CDS:2 [Entrophospora sp. SA101]CAJ0841114.1 18583_t:CDS:2 [Entrophospora sp. SA101]